MNFTPPDGYPKALARVGVERIGERRKDCEVVTDPEPDGCDSCVGSLQRAGSHSARPEGSGFTPSPRNPHAPPVFRQRPDACSTGAHFPAQPLGERVRYEDMRSFPFTPRQALLGLALALPFALLALAPAAHADTLIIAAPGAKNLAAGGGWRAWAAPTKSGRWQLTTRAPDGTISAAKVKSFGAAPDPSIGSTGFGVAEKRVVAVYSRCRGTSSTDGCDVYQYDLAAGTERKLTRISTSASETSPSIASGVLGFVRRGGSKPGTYTATSSRVRRIDTRVARETAVTASRIAYRVGGTILMSQIDGARRRTLVSGRDVFSVVITRYRVGWLQRIGHRTLALMTNRINPSGSVVITPGTHDLPASTQSAVADASKIVEYLGATGVKRASPPLFR